MSLHGTEPHLKHVVWGGRRLGDGVGETFDVSGLSDQASKLVTGPLAGRDLAAAYADDPGHFLDAPHPDRFPLLVKRIDAAQSLSVQVHPDDAAAGRLAGEPNGKSEAWVILDADPGAIVYLGFRPGVTPGEVRPALEAGRILELLQPVSVKRGDVIPVPPGTVHSIGAGVFLFEVQQPSDITYRLYDHDREPRRELHVSEGFDVMRLDARLERPTPRSLGSGEGWERFELVDMGAFSIERWRVTGALDADLGRLAVLHGVSGSTRIARDGAIVDLAAGASLVHSAHGSALRAEGACAELLVAIHRP